MLHCWLDCLISYYYLFMNRETIAVFDFDGTITQKDTLLEFIKFSRGKWRFYGGFLLFFPLLVAMKMRLLPNWKTKQLLFSYYYKGVSIETFNHWGKEFTLSIDKTVRPKVIETLQEHKKRGDQIVIISASIENWIKPWAEKAGIDLILSTQIEVADGLLTGRFSTANCYGQEKVNRLLAAFPNRNEYRLVAYGDSRGDRELIDFADEGYYC